MIVYKDDALTVYRFIAKTLLTNVYVIQANNHAIIIDSFCDENINAIILETFPSVDFLLVTHEHYDHIAWANEFREKYGCKILASEVCSERMRDATKNFSRYFDSYCTLQSGVKIDALVETKKYISYADEVFINSMHFTWQGQEFMLWETPGHTPGSIVIYHPKGNFVFSGDTILPDDLLVTRFPGGNMEDFREITLPHIQSLPDDTLVLPGHGTPFAIGTNKWYNCAIY